VYNAALTINKCIDSILSQSYSNFELLLVNDGSIDESLLICEKYAEIDARISFFNKKNEGVSITRNLGIERAQGQYITFVDSDDYLHKDYLIKLLCGLDYDWDISVCGYVDILNGKEISQYFIDLENKESVFNLKDIYINIFSHPVMSTPYCKLFKSSIIKNYDIKFNENLSSGEDTLFVSDYLFFTDKILIAPEILYYRNIDNGNSLSKRVNINKRLIVFENIYTSRLSIINKWDIEPSLLKAIKVCRNDNIFDLYNQILQYVPKSKKDRKKLLSQNFSEEDFRLLSSKKGYLYFLLKKYKLMFLYDVLIKYILTSKKKKKVVHMEENTVDL